MFRKLEVSHFFFIVLIFTVIPVTGEFNISPFLDSFRIGLGATLFLFYSLFVKKYPILLYGAIAGALVVLFRICFAVYLGNSLEISFLLHFPAFFYYFGYVAVYFLSNAEQHYEKPIIYGLFIVLSDFGGNCLEKIVRFYMLNDRFSLYDAMQLLIISLIRSCFALAFYNAIKLREKSIICKHQDEQNKQMLVLISGLYEETILVKKSLNSAEHITRKCFELYQKAQNEQGNQNNIAQNFLDISKLVHEIKKDNQRIYAGLSKLISKEGCPDYMKVEEIVQVIASTNEKYALSLNKNIKFELHIAGTMPNLHVCTLLSIINNLVVNSVESIHIDGNIKISILHKDENIEIIVFDNGQGIPLSKKDLIFVPGYTTKFDETGKPSTGIGLPYVIEIVTGLGGTVELNSQVNAEYTTTFIIRLPINKLTERE